LPPPFYDGGRANIGLNIIDATMESEKVVILQT
jgi:hypothetical protein